MGTGSVEVACKRQQWFPVVETSLYLYVLCGSHPRL